MNAVIYHSYDDIRIENRPIPSITDTELLVEVSGCGLCGSDILSTRKVRVDGLISHRLPLQQFSEDVTLMQKRATLKVYFQIAGETNGKYTL